MEARVFLGILAIVAAFACLFTGATAFIRHLGNRRSAIAAQGEKPTLPALLSWRVRNGFAFAYPVAEKLLSVKHVSETVDEVVSALEARGLAGSKESVLSVMLVAVVLLAFLVGILVHSVVGAVAIAVCAIAVTYVVAGSIRDKRWEAVRDSAPGALESMAACFGAGFTLLQTFSQVAQDVPGYLGATFSRSAHVLETGGTAEQALDVLKHGAHASELAFVAVALDVQHQSGGSMKQVLDAASDSMKGELALRRSLRVQTAQAKLSARVVVVMPFILVAAFSVLSPDFLAPFFESPMGYALLAVAILMQASGIMLVNRALTVDGVA